MQRCEGSDEDQEKRELVKILMSKCNKTKEEVLAEYDEFYKQHPEGLISKAKYINSTEVKKLSKLRSCACNKEHLHTGGVKHCFF